MGERYLGQFTFPDIMAVINNVALMLLMLLIAEVLRISELFLFTAMEAQLATMMTAVYLILLVIVNAPFTVSKTDWYGLDNVIVRTHYCRRQNSILGWPRCYGRCIFLVFFAAVIVR